MKHGAPQYANSCGDRTGRACLWSGLRNNAIPCVLGLAILLPGLSHPMAGETRPEPDGQLLLTGGTIYINPTDDPITNGVVDPAAIPNTIFRAMGGAVRISPKAAPQFSAYRSSR